MLKHKGIIAKGNEPVKGLVQRAGERINKAVDTMSHTGSVQKAGERIDHVIDKLSGKGPVEKVGQKIDKAIKVLKKK